MNVIPFQLSHAPQMRPNAWQLRQWEDAACSLSREHEGNGWSVFHGKQLLLIGGVVEQFKDEPYLWSFISADAGRHMLSLYRITQRFISTCREPILYATTPAVFLAGCRFLNLLGFNPLMDDGEQLYIDQNGSRDLFYVRAS